MIQCKCGKLFKPKPKGEKSRMCLSCASNRRSMINKIKCVEYLGGKCQNCGYNACIASMDFHHIDPNTKERKIANSITCSWNTLKQELDKCRLLCANCHREFHWKEKEKTYKLDYNFGHFNIDVLERNCLICNEKFTTTERINKVFCSSRCSGTNRNKIQWPDIYIILNELKSTSFLELGKKYGVSDNAIRKHLIKHGINPKIIKGK